MSTNSVPPNLPSSSFNPVFLQQKLEAYVESRSTLNDKSMTSFQSLVNQIITDLTNTNKLINSSSALINQHTHQQVVPAGPAHPPPPP